jgi:hypothetical protein
MSEGLAHRLDLALRRLYGRSSEKIDAHQLLLFSRSMQKEANSLKAVLFENDVIKEPSRGTALAERFAAAGCVAGIRFRAGFGSGRSEVWHLQADVQPYEMAMWLDTPAGAEPRAAVACSPKLDPV